MDPVSSYLLVPLQAIAQREATWIIQQTCANCASRVTTKTRSGETVASSAGQRRRPNQQDPTKRRIADVSLPDACPEKILLLFILIYIYTTVYFSYLCVNVNFMLDMFTAMTLFLIHDLTVYLYTLFNILLYRHDNAVISTNMRL